MKFTRSGRRRRESSAAGPRGRQLSLLAASLAVASFAAAAFLWFGPGSSVGDGPPAQAATTPQGPVLTVSTPQPTPSDKPTPGRTRTPQPSALDEVGAPQRVVIESLDIDAPVLPISTEGNTLTPPPDPQDLGWWQSGAQAGAARGSALITGHTVNAGGGALDDLETLKPGTEIEVRTTGGLIRYVAESVVVLDKTAIARQAPQLFSQEVDGRLVLITCEDWDGTGYRSNVVVTAVPLI